MKCTWEGCEVEASVPQVGEDGQQWANLCTSHHAEIETSMVSLDAKTVLRSWIKAQGGSRAAANRMMGTGVPQKTAQLAAAMAKRVVK